MILFPIALLWLVVVLVWIIRNSKNKAEPPDVPEDPPKRFRPSPRHDPTLSGSRSRARTASSAARRRD